MCKECFKQVLKQTLYVQTHTHTHTCAHVCTRHSDTGNSKIMRWGECILTIPLRNCLSKSPLQQLFSETALGIKIARRGPTL